MLITHCDSILRLLVFAVLLINKTEHCLLLLLYVLSLIKMADAAMRLALFEGYKTAICCIGGNEVTEIKLLQI